MPALNILHGRRAVRFISGHYGFACKVLATDQPGNNARVYVVLLHDDGSSSHYKRAIRASLLHKTRADAIASWAAGKEQRKQDKRVSADIRDTARREAKARKRIAAFHDGIDLRRAAKLAAM